MLRRLPGTLAFLCGALLLAAPARADEAEGLRVHFSPHAGAALWLDDIDLATDVLFGGRFGVGYGPYFGLEGTVDLTPTHVDGDADLFNRVTHVSGAAVVRLAPYARVTPYLTAGWANLHFDPGYGSESNSQGFEAGGGVEIRLAGATGRRVDLRLDARNVFLSRDLPGGVDESPQNTLLLSAGVQFTLGGDPRDTDLDGVPDRRDECARTPLRAVVDDNGCPLDTDRDGVFDGIDLCPDTPHNAMVGPDGCALDSDGDGVVDGVDTCPDTPTGARVDARGCGLDADGDGVFDGLDACPDTPAGASVDPLDGCALDGDGDGVPDGIDRCEGTPAGVRVDEEGCPVPTSQREAELLDTGMIRLSNVTFESGSAVLKPGSYEVLREVGTILSRWPQLRIEIGGHTDSVGSEQANQELSEQRAQAVYRWLVQNFPATSVEQFTVRGYGETRSISTNDTALGRSQNRRVEFKVLNREVLRQ